MEEKDTARERWKKILPTRRVQVADLLRHEINQVPPSEMEKALRAAIAVLEEVD